MNIGIDLGRTIVQSDPKRAGSHFKSKRPFPKALKVIKKLTKRHNVYIVSKVNSEQKEAAEKWFEESDFFNKTGIKKENVYFCFERRDKAFFIKGLDISVFIDDRPEVLSHVDATTHKILFRPSKEDLKTYASQIKNQQMTIVEGWGKIERIFDFVWA